MQRNAEDLGVRNGVAEEAQHSEGIPGKGEAAVLEVTAGIDASVGVSVGMGVGVRRLRMSISEGGSRVRTATWFEKGLPSHAVQARRDRGAVGR